MIHITKSKHGYTVETISSSRGKRNLSSTSSQLFTTVGEAWDNILAQMKEWGRPYEVLVQYNGAVYKFFNNGLKLKVSPGVKPEKI